MRLMCMVGIVLATVTTGRGEPFQQTLTSVHRNLNLESWSVTSRDVTPDCAVPWSVRKYRLHGGKQDGVDVVEVNNGTLTIVVVPTRGMGIWSVTSGDVRLGWDSPVKEIVHPKFINLTSRGGLGWLDGFGDFMCRCGLASNGHPGTDTMIDNTGATTTVELTLHGRIAYLPAQEVSVEVETSPPYTLRLRGSVAERMMFGPNLELRTEISTVPGSAGFRITDEIINHAGKDAEFQVLYHCNFGRPLLGEGSRFIGPVKRVNPFNARAAEGGVSNFANYGGPQAGYVEQVYCLELYADADGRTKVMLQNRAADRAVSMAYALKSLPYLSIWKNTTTEADGYVTGIEPGTGFSYTRSIERQAGRVPKLAPGQRHRVALDVTIHVGTAEVSRLRNEIRTIRGDRPTRIEERPLEPTH